MTGPGPRNDDPTTTNAHADPRRTLRSVHYQVLGPLTATIDDRTVNLGGPKQRLVLALLLVEAGRTVTAERLIDRIWDDAPPEGARHTLQAYISELRKLLDRIAGNGKSEVAGSGASRGKTER